MTTSTTLPPIALIGLGGLGSAIATGFCKQYPADNLYGFDVDSDKMRTLASVLGISTVPDVTLLPQQCRIFVLAVKPKDTLSLVYKIAPHLQPESILISVAAGIRRKHLQDAAGMSMHIVRAMPNSCAEVLQSSTGIVSESLGDHASAITREIFSSIGEVIELHDESLLDPTTALGASAPAFLYLVLEALADGGVKAGLSRDIAQRMAAQVMRGAAEMALHSGKHTSMLKDAVTSPAGTTIAGLAVLEQRGVRGALIEAIDTASKRAKELGEK